MWQKKKKENNIQVKQFFVYHFYVRPEYVGVCAGVCLCVCVCVYLTTAII